ncbi:MAG: diaminobutyrate acetyltransferase [Campylobacterota bacterium]
MKTTSTTKGRNIEEDSYIIRHPDIKDGLGIYQLVKKTKVLDVNSSYLYNLIGAHFSDTSLVVTQKQGKNESIVGFISGYLLPDQPNVLFIWQVGVDASMRGKGLAKKLVTKLIREHEDKIDTIHTTVSPSNTPSNKLFDSIAKSYDTSITEETFLDIEDFEQGHEEEILKIIPIKEQ